MGNVTPTITDILHREEENLAKFRRALRREDQIVFDDLFTAAYKHRAAAAYAGHLLPFETFLLSMQIEDHKEVMSLRREVGHLQSQIEKLMTNSTKTEDGG
jgi:FtsZ-binding cell division protein ZapB